MDRIVVTGVAGFIGFHFSKKLLRNRYEVFGIDNINNYYDVNLKKARLKKLHSHDKFIFNQIDISNKDGLEYIFKSLKPKSFGFFLPTG